MGYFVQGTASSVNCTLGRPNHGTNSAGQDGALIASFFGLSTPAATEFQPDAWQPDYIQEFSQGPILTAFQTDAWEPDFIQEFAALSAAPAFLGWGFDAQQVQPSIYSQTSQRQAALSQREDGIESPFINFLPSGWEIQSVQPQSYTTYNLRTPTAGALSQREDGIEAPYVFVPSGQTITWGFEQTNPPPFFRTKQVTPFKGDDGIEKQFILFNPYGWEIQSYQPQHQFYEKKGAILRGDDGDQSPYINFFPYGWEIPSPQPPHQFFEKRGSILKGDDGNQAQFIRFFPYGWEIQPPQPPFRINQNRGTILKGDEGIQSPYINFLPYGWEIAPYQPQHSFYEKKGGILRGIDGIEGNFINFYPFGWEIQPPQPPNYPTTRQKTGSWSHPEDGIEAPYVFVSGVQIIWGFDGPLVYPRKLIKHLESPVNIDAPFINFYPYGFEVQPPQPPYRTIRIPSILRGDDGTQAQLINFFSAGWEIQPYQPQHLRPERASSWLFGDLGIEAPFIPPIPSFIPTQGFENQAFQPPYHINRLQAFLRGDDGTEAPFVNWYNFGWEIPPPPPPHTFIEKRGLILRGDDGTEGTFIRFFPYGWEVAPYQPPHRQPENKAATFLQGDQGTQQVLVKFFPGGWVIQPVQPPHPEPEIAGAIMVGDQGTQGIYNFVPPPPVVLKPGWLIRARHTGRR